MLYNFIFLLIFLKVLYLLSIFLDGYVIGFWVIFGFNNFSVFVLGVEYLMYLVFIFVFFGFNKKFINSLVFFLFCVVVGIYIVFIYLLVFFLGIV